ncbi:VCBS repeat-containing protein [Kribbella orskensis]|uniref:VCBS repeat-containing protein n=1 Tax=Kribbella orskensis TaxID=2512216 RepID=A0ABY2BI01_9ACTN|nr:MULTISPECIES: PIG-L family deacetylase [Kribbella]TCN38746.1 VCBS repeat-containing protein [Kribbella sp. VKM Ac-2500]TCO20927.1 VCBS repeat-containing protein [Kribbella orskensis]
MKRLFSLLAASILLTGLAVSVPAEAGPPPQYGSEGNYVADRDTKIDVMGEWAHPDDDTSIIGPCGVWHQLYGVKCGVIMVTRGEGGGNAVGTELGPDLGLRRENEDRVAHYRSGTLDIFNLDRVDFFYNQSAPLTQYFWDEEETLRRVTRVIRTTQPEIYIGFTPTLAAGHGNHQQAGRLIWEGVLAAADPTKFPEQLRGPDALSTWQVKKVFSGGSTTGTGGTTTAANCTTGFVPTPGTNLDTVAGVWTGYDSQYKWPTGNLQGKPVGSAKIWQQVADEGRAAYPTQSRVMFKGASAPACSRFGMTQSFVPFQPNTADGTANPAAGRDDAILFGATEADPGGLPKGTLEYLTFSRFLNVAGEPFQATLHLKAGSGQLKPGKVALTVPAGWTVDGPKQVGAVSDKQETTVTFTVTPSATAPVNQNAKISALYTSQAETGYTDNVVRIVSPTEGRFERWGNWAEYDEWLADTAPQAIRLGRSAAIQSMSIGSTLAVPVVVHNWSNQPQSGTVGLTLPANFTADATSKPYSALAPGAETTVTFQVTNTDTALPATQNVSIPITTTYSAPAGTGNETLTLSLVPSTAIAQSTTTPVVDGTAAPGEYSGPTLDLGRIWQGAATCTGVDDCGVSPTGEGSTAKVSWSEDALYFFIHIRDDYQSYAVTPQECVGHWQADSVEILLDPRGTASQVLKDTANTFKLGIFPFTNDPSASNGNGANGPCWSRDADNHQGYSTGPLAGTVSDAPNAPGVQVASTATWVGTNETTTPHAYAGGGYDLEVKIPLADLPAAVDPAKLGLNITPYDNDDTSAAGTTTLRHIDMSTRLGWSALGSVQSDPYRWGRATMPGYTPPADRPTTPSAPNVSSPNLNGALSPQTIAQSARNDVPISGRVPTSGLEVLSGRLGESSVELVTSSSVSGTARMFLTSGELGAIPVYTTSCSPAADPAPDYGLTPCAVTDGGIPAWSPDLSGHLVKQDSKQITGGVQKFSIPLTAAQRAKLAADGHLLISFETPQNEVQAFDLKLSR